MLTFSELRLPSQLTLCQLLQSNAHLLRSVTSFTTHCMSSNSIKLLITLYVSKFISGPWYLISLRYTWLCFQYSQILFTDFKGTECLEH